MNSPFSLMEKRQQGDSQHQDDQGNPEMAVAENCFEHCGSMRWIDSQEMYRAITRCVKAGSVEEKACEHLSNVVNVSGTVLKF